MDAARFFACTAPYASAWLSDPFLARPMTDEAHGAACKLRLNQPISSLRTCHCGHDLQNDPWHVLSHKGGGEAGRRHDEIVDRLVDAIHRAGGQAWAEPRQDFWQDRRRTDIFAVMGPKSYHIDVRVTHPTAVSYVTLACQGSLLAAEEAAQEKKRRYAAMAHAEGASFVPFIVETFGGFGKDARAFIAELAKYATVGSRLWSAAETRFMVRAEVQRALFEGNLRVANAVLQESNPIRYASGRFQAVPPRPRRGAQEETPNEDTVLIQSTDVTSVVASTEHSEPPVQQVADEQSSARETGVIPVPIFQPQTPPRVPRGHPASSAAVSAAVPMELSRSQPSQLPPLSQSTSVGTGSDEGTVAPSSSLPATTRTLSSGRQLLSPQRPSSGTWVLTEVSRPRLEPSNRRNRQRASRQPSQPTSTQSEGSTPSANLQHQPQIPPYPPPIPPSHLQTQIIHPQTNPQSPVTSSQTTTTTNNRQSSTTIATTTPSLNGTQTQFTSRMEGNVALGSPSARVASRNEALSLLDRIHATAQSQAAGTINSNQSRSERSNWRNNGSRTIRPWSHGHGRRRGHPAGNGNVQANQVHTTTPQTGASMHR